MADRISERQLPHTHISCFGSTSTQSSTSDIQKNPHSLMIKTTSRTSESWLNWFWIRNLWVLRLSWGEISLKQQHFSCSGNLSLNHTFPGSEFLTGFPCVLRYIKNNISQVVVSGSSRDPALCQNPEWALPCLHNVELDEVRSFFCQHFVRT
jgi:hypothetical protein